MARNDRCTQRARSSFQRDRLEADKVPPTLTLFGTDQSIGDEGGDDEFQDAIKLYLRDIGKTKLLSADQEKELASRVAQGDRSAREKLILANLRLVVAIAKRYRKRGLPFVDLIEEGNIGLIKAVERFSILRGCRLSTYATWWIRQSIERALVNQGRTVRLPVHIADQVHKVMKVARELAKQLNREPNAREVAEVLQVRVSHVRSLMLLYRSCCSLEQSMGENKDFYLGDVLYDADSVLPSEYVENMDGYEVVSRFFGSLTAAEQKILTLRFGLFDTPPETLDTIGRRFGVTRERIRQIEVKSLEKLRQLVNKAQLEAETRRTQESDGTETKREKKDNQVYTS